MTTGKSEGMANSPRNAETSLQSKHNRDLAKKLRHRFVGPFKILKRITPAAYELETSNEMQMHDVFHVSLLRPYKARKEYGVGAPPVLLPSGEVQHEVQEIVGHADDVDDERWYQVKWQNHGDVTWEPAKHLSNATGLIRSYFEKLGIVDKKPQRRRKRAVAQQSAKAPEPKIPEPTIEESIAKRVVKSPNPESGNLRTADKSRHFLSISVVSHMERDLIHRVSLASQS